MGFPGGSVLKNPPGNAGDAGSVPGFRRPPGEGNDNRLVFLPGKSHGQRSLPSYSPWVAKRVGRNLAIKQHHQSLGVLDSIYSRIFRESQSIGFSPFSAFSFLSPIVFYFFLCTDFCCLRIFCNITTKHHSCNNFIWKILLRFGIACCFSFFWYS